jgi:hypothetical protein
MRASVNPYFAWAGVVACVAGGVGCGRNGSAGAAPSPSAVASAAPVDDSFPIPKEKVDAVVNPNHLAAYDGPTGSVEGTILVIGPDAPDVNLDARACPAAVDTYGKLFRSGTPATPNGPRPLADAAVIAVGYGGYYIPEREPAKKVTIGVNCAYPARTITMTYGQRLEIANKSKYPFAPTLESASTPAVMMAAPLESGDPIRLYPREAGHSMMGDFMQPFMREEVYVLRHPLHTVSGVDGHYRIDGVPVGKLSIAAQHAMVGSEAHAPIDIVANVVAKLDLTLEYKPRAANAGLKQDNILR